MKREKWYLASPYSHPNEEVKKKRYDEICIITARIIKYDSKVIPFSPIVYSHVLESEYMTQIDWIDFDLEMLQLFDVLCVVMLDGWNESKGVSLEIKYALENDIPIIYLDPANYLVLERRYETYDHFDKMPKRAVFANVFTRKVLKV